MRRAQVLLDSLEGPAPSVLGFSCCWATLVTSDGLCHMPSSRKEGVWGVEQGPLPATSWKDGAVALGLPSLGTEPWPRPRPLSALGLSPPAGTADLGSRVFQGGTVSAGEVKLGAGQAVSVLRSRRAPS